MPEGSKTSQYKLPGLSPAGCLALLWPKLSTALVNHTIRNRLWVAACQLPPIPRIALEVRLAEHESAVDLHQMITRGDDDPRILSGYLKGHTPSLTSPALKDFLRSWATDEEALQASFDHLYLEWDSTDGPHLPHAPAIFLAMDDREHKPDGGAKRRQLVREIVARLQGRHGIPPNNAFAGRENLTIGHVGVMLGRGSTIRCNYRRIFRQQLAPLLEELRWPGDIEWAARHFDALVGLADRVTVGLDFLHSVLPSIGFEIFLDHPLSLGPRWRAVLDYLSEQGLCAPEKTAALQLIDAYLTPDRSGQTWPASWLAAAAAAPSSTRPAVRICMSHLKLSLAHDGSASAKAYISAEHFWNMERADQRCGDPVRSASSLASTRSRAIAFLLSCQQQSGFWSDFNCANGGSGSWVSAVVARALATSGNATAEACADHVAALLLRKQRQCGGWGYSDQYSPDSDSTAAVLKCLHVTGHERKASARACQFLMEHFTLDGGFSTYAADTPIPLRNRSLDVRGWRASHLCVVANCAPFLPERLIPLLRAHQQANGSWLPYWWRTPLYATALAVEALAPAASERSLVDRAVAWARRQSVATATAFDAANLVQILLQGGALDVEAASPVVGRLRESQLADGSWASGAELLIPPPDRVVATPDMQVILDDKRLFTTAIVLAALTAYKHAKAKTSAMLSERGP